MLFNSFIFILLFLPATYFTWLFMTRCDRRLGKVALICASLTFYAYWNVHYVWLLLLSVVFNYLLHCQLSLRARDRLSWWLMCMGISVNLGIIGYYKYFNFFAENFANVFGITHESVNIFLPLGISFFTFQQIACLVDTYKGEMEKVSFSEYILFVTFFPQLIAGPIVRAKEIIPQLVRMGEQINVENIKFGLCLFAFGLFKKVVIADYFSPIVGIVFSHAETANFFDALLGTLAYTLQIYFDFSGYSDMAIGLGMLFGIRLPINFDSPYKSCSIIEFWRRWHITLSGFLKDYLYIPLGGSRQGEMRKYCNLMATMLLGGLWHGAGWTFVLWGGTHGFYLVCNHFWKKHKYSLSGAQAWLLTFISVWFAWIFFRADNIMDAVHIFSALAGSNGTAWGESLLAAANYKLFSLSAKVVLAIAVCKYLPNAFSITGKLKKLPQPVYALSGGLLLAYAMYIMTYSNRVSEFLYFQF